MMISFPDVEEASGSRVTCDNRLQHMVCLKDKLRCSLSKTYVKKIDDITNKLRLATDGATLPRAHCDEVGQCKKLIGNKLTSHHYITKHGKHSRET